jgi:bacillolysin
LLPSNAASAAQETLVKHRAAPILVAVSIFATGLLSAPRAQEAQRFIAFATAGEQVSRGASLLDAMLVDGSLDIARSQEDTVMPGRLHERLEQRYEGLPVFSGEVVRQMDGRGSPLSLFGRVYEGIDIDAVPAIAPERALAIAQASEGTETASLREPLLGIYPRDDGTYALAYRLRIATSEDIQVYYVNAATGQVELHYSDLQSQSIIGSGTGVFGDAKKVWAFNSGGMFRADDRLRPAQGQTMDFRGSLTRLNAFLFTLSTGVSDQAVDADNNWTDGAVVDAQTYQGLTYDYYFKRHGRRSVDDRNLRIIGIVHPLYRADAASYTPSQRGSFINNALYLGNGYMMYGDGDGILFEYLAGGLDVVAHELTHGVTDFTSRLEYRNESGALNEAFSDIMGTAVEFYYQSPGAGRQRGDWQIGEDVTRFSPGFIRSMQNPRLLGDPDHYSVRFTGTADNGGVHINAGIANHAFFLAVAGGTNRVSGISVAGIGLSNIERMEKIFYRAFAFMLGVRSQYRDARAATLQAAADLYGGASNEYSNLEAAWNAVGVNP